MFNMQPNGTRTYSSSAPTMNRWWEKKRPMAGPPGSMSGSPMAPASLLDNPANLQESYAPPVPQQAPQKVAGAPMGPPGSLSGAPGLTPQQTQTMNTAESFAPPVAQSMPGNATPQNFVQPAGRLAFDPTPQMVNQARIQDIVRMLTGRKAQHQLSNYDILGRKKPSGKRNIFGHLIG